MGSHTSLKPFGSHNGQKYQILALSQSLLQWIWLEYPMKIDHITRNLTIYPKIFTIGKLGSTKNLPNTRKDLISEDHITGTQCSWN